MHVLLQRHVAHHPHGAEAFRREQRDLVDSLRRVDPRDDVKRQVGDAAVGDGIGMVERPGRLPDHVAGKLQPDGAVGELRPDRLMLDDVAPALPPDFRVIHCGVKSGAPQPEIDGRKLQCAMRERRALPRFTERVPGGHAAVLEGHAGAGSVMPADRLADRLQRVAHRQAGGRARHEQRHATARARLRLDRDELCDRRVRDERQAAIDHPVGSLLRRDRQGAALSERPVVTPAEAGGGIASCMRQVVAVILDEIRQEAAALLRRHQAVEQHVTERAGVRQYRGEVHVPGAQLLHHDAGGEGIGAGAARLLGQAQGAQSHLGSLVHEIREQRLLERLEPPGIQRRGLDLALHEVAHRVAEFELLGGEMKVVHVSVP